MRHKKGRLVVTSDMSHEARTEEVSEKILTIPNVVTFIRFLMVPLFLWLMFGMRMETAGLVVFAIAASTDWVDGQLARRLGQVSKVGKLFDPFVDRLLLASGVVSVCALGRLPVWIVVLLVLRDIVILGQGRYMLKTVGAVPPVSYIGKFATAFLMFGYAFCMLGAPVLSGLGIVEASWLPGLGSQGTYLGVYLVYIGMVLSLTVFVVYQVRGTAMFSAWRKEQQREESS